MLETMFNSFITIFKFMRILDIVDILIVAFILYKVFKLAKDTRAFEIIKGVIIIILALQISSWLDLYLLNYILKNTMQVGVLAAVMIFQPEIRRGLEKIGGSRLSSFFDPDYKSEGEIIISVSSKISQAAEKLSQTKTGALIVIERKTKLGEIINTGISVNAELSPDLINQIFVPNTPLHDGAVVVRDDKIIAATCLLPLTQSRNLSTELGTRHRAAIGMTENSDCVVVVVSEETGKISLAIDGTLTRNLNGESLSKSLTKILSTEETVKPYNKFTKLKEKIKKGDK